MEEELEPPRRVADRSSIGTMIELPRAGDVRRPDRAARRLLLVRHQRPDADDARRLARRRRGQVPGRLRRGRRDPRPEPVRRPSTSTAWAGSCGWARETGRGARPGLKLGICGEHGGDPASVALLPRRRASTTCRARRSACRWPGWRPPRRRSAAVSGTADGHPRARRRGARSAGLRLGGRAVPRRPAEGRAAADGDRRPARDHRAVLRAVRAEGLRRLARAAARRAARRRPRAHRRGRRRAGHRRQHGQRAGDLAPARHRRRAAHRVAARCAAVGLLRRDDLLVRGGRDRLVPRRPRRHARRPRLPARLGVPALRRRGAPPAGLHAAGPRRGLPARRRRRRRHRPLVRGHRAARGGRVPPGAGAYRVEPSGETPLVV